MLIRYTCKRMGLNCPFNIDSETMEEVSKQALAHVIELHPKNINIVKLQEEILRVEKALTRSTI